MATCRRCYWAKMSDIGNPLERHCVAKRKKLEKGEAMTSLIAGKMVMAGDEACELFKPKGRGGVDKRDLDT